MSSQQKDAFGGTNGSQAAAVAKAVQSINGETRLLAIIGDPVSQVRSPLVYNPLIAQGGHNAVLVPWHAPAKDFAAVMQGLMLTANLDGIVVTYPFKQLAFERADRLGFMAERVGAVNALRREPDGTWAGDMFDGFGLVRAVTSIGHKIAGKKVKLIGAGGAGSAIALALADAGAASLSIYDSDGSRAKNIAKEINVYYPACAVEAGSLELGNADILINATPIGLKPEDGLPIPLKALSNHVVVVDIVPSHRDTPLLKLARQCGCAHVGGAAMVEGQAEVVLNFFGIPDSIARPETMKNRQELPPTKRNPS